MSLLSRISAWLKSLLGRSEAEQASAPTISVRPADGAATAVAGFVQRAHVDRFRLAARLASISRLNTPEGRKPWTAQRRAVYAPAIPVERLGAKKVRLGASAGLRVLPQIEARKRVSAEIIPFPVRSAGVSQLRAGVSARAA
jgi:hypothetical protein